ncbi:MAG: hypothetical protein CVU63_10290 [Deltaproteobacteria bacterium HGW-Deltaproteobacteria-20]|jgi:hypothetical protein|nr:MAG: hypothetical protein CVU63_10290 [Deltaproteobacteria bacterium HGW-Deltaproteobacteria-20]
MMVGVGLLALGCGAGGAADQVRPKDATYHDAVGGPSVNVAPTECREVGGAADPLVIDWKPEDRSDIEVAMKEGIAVVQFDCKTIRLLRDCNPLGRYAFIPVTQKVQVIRLVNADEITQTCRSAAQR